jgi:hypothetical protein
VGLLTIRRNARKGKVDLLQVNQPAAIQRIFEQDIIHSTVGFAKGRIDEELERHQSQVGIHAPIMELTPHLGILETHLPQKNSSENECAICTGS